MSGAQSPKNCFTFWASEAAPATFFHIVRDWIAQFTEDDIVIVDASPTCDVSLAFLGGQGPGDGINKIYLAMENEKTVQHFIDPSKGETRSDPCSFCIDLNEGSRVKLLCGSYDLEDLTPKLESKPLNALRQFTRKMSEAGRTVFVYGGTGFSVFSRMALASCDKLILCLSSGVTDARKELDFVYSNQLNFPHLEPFAASLERKPRLAVVVVTHQDMLNPETLNGRIIDVTNKIRDAIDKVVKQPTHITHVPTIYEVESIAREQGSSPLDSLIPIPNHLAVLTGMAIQDVVTRLKVEADETTRPFAPAPTADNATKSPIELVFRVFKAQFLRSAPYNRRELPVLKDEDEVKTEAKGKRRADESGAAPAKRVKVEDSRWEPCDDDDCLVCFSTYSPDKNPILYCGKCSTRVHKHCYEVDSVPSGEWYCDPCKANSSAREESCRLCALKEMSKRIHTDDGVQACPDVLVKLSGETGGYAHPQCVKELPYPSKGLSDLGKQACSICGESSGVCRKCQYRECSRWYHVTCAQLDKAYADANRVQDIVYCPDHLTRDKEELYQFTCRRCKKERIAWMNGKTTEIPHDCKGQNTFKIQAVESTLNAAPVTRLDFETCKDPPLCRKLQAIYDDDVKLLSDLKFKYKKVEYMMNPCYVYREAENRYDLAPRGYDEPDIAARFRADPHLPVPPYRAKDGFTKIWKDVFKGDVVDWLREDLNKDTLDTDLARTESDTSLKKNDGECEIGIVPEDGNILMALPGLKHLWNDILEVATPANLGESFETIEKCAEHVLNESQRAYVLGDTSVGKSTIIDLLLSISTPNLEPSKVLKSAWHEKSSEDIGRFLLPPTNDHASTTPFPTEFRYSEVYKVECTFMSYEELALNIRDLISQYKAKQHRSDQSVAVLNTILVGDGGEDEGNDERSRKKRGKQKKDNKKKRRRNKNSGNATSVDLESHPIWKDYFVGRSEFGVEDVKRIEGNVYEALNGRLEDDEAQKIILKKLRISDEQGSASFRDDSGSSEPEERRDDGAEERQLTITVEGDKGDKDSGRGIIQKALKKVLNAPRFACVLKQVVVYVPSVLLETGLVLVDTPGGNDGDELKGFILQKLLDRLKGGMNGAFVSGKMLTETLKKLFLEMVQDSKPSWMYLHNPEVLGNARKTLAQVRDGDAMNNGTSDNGSDAMSDDNSSEDSSDGDSDDELSNGTSDNGSDAMSDDKSHESSDDDSDDELKEIRQICEKVATDLAKALNQQSAAFQSSGLDKLKLMVRDKVVVTRPSLFSSLMLSGKYIQQRDDRLIGYSSAVDMLENLTANGFEKNLEDFGRVVKSFNYTDDQENDMPEGWSRRDMREACEKALCHVGQNETSMWNKDHAKPWFDDLYKSGADPCCELRKLHDKLERLDEQGIEGLTQLDSGSLHGFILYGTTVRQQSLATFLIPNKDDLLEKSIAFQRELEDHLRKKAKEVTSEVVKKFLREMKCELSETKRDGIVDRISPAVVKFHDTAVFYNVLDHILSNLRGGFMKNDYEQPAKYLSEKMVEYRKKFVVAWKERLKKLFAKKWSQCTTNIKKIRYHQLQRELEPPSDTKEKRRQAKSRLKFLATQIDELLKVSKERCAKAKAQKLSSRIWRFSMLQEAILAETEKERGDISCQSLRNHIRDILDAQTPAVSPSKEVESHIFALKKTGLISFNRKFDIQRMSGQQSKGSGEGVESFVSRYVAFIGVPWPPFSKVWDHLVKKFNEEMLDKETKEYFGWSEDAKNIDELNALLFFAVFYDRRIILQVGGPTSTNSSDIDLLQRSSSEERYPSDVVVVHDYTKGNGSGNVFLIGESGSHDSEHSSTARGCPGHSNGRATGQREPSPTPNDQTAKRQGFRGLRTFTSEHEYPPASEVARSTRNCPPGTEERAFANHSGQVFALSMWYRTPKKNVGAYVHRPKHYVNTNVMRIRNQDVWVGDPKPFTMRPEFFETLCDEQLQFGPISFWNRPKVWGRMTKDQDAFFTTSHCLAVVDGDSAAVHSRDVSRSLAYSMYREAFKSQRHPKDLNMSRVIARSAYQEVVKHQPPIGWSGNACLALATIRFSEKPYMSHIDVWSCGDCRVFLLRQHRNGWTVERESSCKYYQGVPTQLMVNSKRIPYEDSEQLLSDSERSYAESWPVKAGDIIIMGSDGVWDNLSDLSASQNNLSVSRSASVACKAVSQTGGNPPAILQWLKSRMRNGYGHDKPKREAFTSIRLASKTIVDDDCTLIVAHVTYANKTVEYSHIPEKLKKTPRRRHVSM